MAVIIADTKPGKPLVKFVAGNVYYASGYDQFYMAAVHGDDCYLVNLRSGCLLITPDNKENTEDYMRIEGIVEVACEIHV